MGIPPAPRGMPQIEVAFDIDANGIVHVTAKDKATNKEQSIRIQANGGLSDADIEKMVKEAEANATADKARKDLVEAQNSADALIHSTEKALSEHGDKIGAEEKTAIETALTDLKAARDGADPEAIREKTNALAQASMKLGEAMYAAQQGSGEAAAEGQPADDGVVDAEFEEVSDSDDKKSA
jgi:molecular chaperone DnaK